MGAVITTRQLRELDLVGPADIGARLGVTAQAIATWRGRARLEFPRPELAVSRVPLWRWKVVDEWAKRTGRSVEVSRGEFTTEDLATATRLLPTVRAMLVREVEDAARAASYVFDEALALPPTAVEAPRVNGRFVRYASADTRGATAGAMGWDAFYALPISDQMRLRSHMSADGIHLDVLADILNLTDEAVIAVLVNAARLADAAKLLARGKVPTFEFDAATTYDVGRVFSEDGATELARAWQDERDRLDSIEELEPLPELDPADLF